MEKGLVRIPLLLIILTLFVFTVQAATGVSMGISSKAVNPSIEVATPRPSMNWQMILKTFPKASAKQDLKRCGKK